ncbi:MAG: HAD-IIA family hydrolase [Chloroflexi bacterium]|nr:HAD-IIA family hydrolase [Chloroflexota bacterium]
MKKNNRSFTSIQGVVFDLDGTVYLGEAALPTAVEAIAALRAAGKRVIFVSNKPLNPRRAYAEKLTRLGIPATADEVITSGYVLGRRLARTAPHQRLFVIGEAPLLAELRSHGLDVIDDLHQDPMQVIDPSGIDGVVVAFDRTLDYKKLNTAYQALRRGAHFYATNADKACPMPGGFIPDAGATIAALEHITGRKVELVAGKPSSLTAEATLERLGLPPERCLMVGDRLETDIRMGQQAGMWTAVTLTGASTREEAERLKPAPDFIVDALDELVEIVLGK